MFPCINLTVSFSLCNLVVCVCAVCPGAFDGFAATGGGGRGWGCYIRQGCLAANMVRLERGRGRREGGTGAGVRGGGIQFPRQLRRCRRRECVCEGESV